MRRRFTTDGYLTVLVSLVVTLFLSLVLAFFQSARTGAAKMRAEMVTEIAIDSVLAEYHRELFRRYGLLFIDTSYGSAVADTCNTEEHLRKYAQMNFSKTAIGDVTDTADFTGLYVSTVKVPSYIRATDGNGAVLRRQILDYMTAEPLEAAFTEATDNVSLLRAEGYDTRDVAAEMEDNYAELQQALAAEGASEGDIDPTVSELHARRALGVLTLTHPDRSSISDASVTPGSYVSKRGASTGGSYSGSESLSATERLLIDQYFFEKCGNYTNVRDGSRLQYQIEYLIAGKPSDYANLESVATTLLFWREASNFAYIMTDQSKQTKAQAVAVVVSLLTLTPEIEEPLKLAVLFSWSFAESVSDIRTLFEGGKVPLIKTKDTWRTSFAALLGFPSGGKGGTGLDYEGYLRMLLLMTDLNDKTWRFMDLIEMDIRETEGNLNFRIDGCLDEITVQMTVSSGIGFEGTYVRTRGYTEREEVHE